MAERLRGRRGMVQRERRLRDHPLCAECENRGITSPTEEIDHITPLSQGGEDTDGNCQGLCLPCHLIKSAGEDTAHEAAANHPDWLRLSNIPLTIVAGPPCSGKTTHVSTHARDGDVIIDLDGIMMKLRPGYMHWSGALDSMLLNKAVRVRNAMLGALAQQRYGQAWFIASAPTEAERRWWQAKTGGEALLLHPGVDECKRRALARGTPQAVAGVDAWERAARMPWVAPEAKAKRVTIGADGWPIG